MHKRDIKLGVNIDHIAVLREARRVNDPDPIQAIGICQRAGADQITIHLREDRRHINDRDAEFIISHSPLPVNLECSIDDEIIDFVVRHKPARATIVPEKREEVTTEGGLDVEGAFTKLKSVISRLKEAEVEVSLFIDPNPISLLKAKELNVEWVEFHTGRYANIYAMLYGNLSNTPHSIKELELDRATLKKMLSDELKNLQEISDHAKGLHIKVAAGHGLNYQNVSAISAIESIEELNIGQSIIARSVFTGLERAILDMREAIRGV